jgi:hypothetical protein
MTAKKLQNDDAYIASAAPTTATLWQCYGNTTTLVLLAPPTMVTQQQHNRDACIASATRITAKQWWRDNAGVTPDNAVWKLAERRAAAREGGQGVKDGSLSLLLLSTATSTATAAIGGPGQQCGSSFRGKMVVEMAPRGGG